MDEKNLKKNMEMIAKKNKDGVGRERKKKGRERRPERSL